MDKLFLHICCGPCAAWPLEFFQTRRPNLKLELWFHNPNIHPRGEFLRRRDSLAFLAAHHHLWVDFSSPYRPEEFLAALTQPQENSAPPDGDTGLRVNREELVPQPPATIPQPPERCRRCYYLRFKAAAQTAASRGHRAFSTTLAFSKRQRHDLIVEEGNRAAAEQGLEFYYEDWRPGWQRGHEIAKSLGLYRQNYCGCIYSELER